MHLDDISCLASAGVPANQHFARIKPVNHYIDAALVEPTTTFFVKIDSIKTPIIVQGLFECRSIDPPSTVMKQHGIHHGSGNLANAFKINPNNHFDLFKEA